VAPLLVFVLVMSAIIGHKQGQKTNMKPILLLYVLGTFLAAAVAVASSLPLQPASGGRRYRDHAAGGHHGSAATLLFNVVTNPVRHCWKPTISASGLGHRPWYRHAPRQ
jgi:serine/threonine transporter